MSNVLYHVNTRGISIQKEVVSSWVTTTSVKWGDFERADLYLLFFCNNYVILSLLNFIGIYCKIRHIINESEAII